MATTANIHPVRFNFEQHCSMRDMGWRQPVQWGDDTQFQFSLDLCATERNLILNESFDTNSDWTAAGTAFIDTINGWGVKYVGAGVGQISQSFTVADDVYLFLTFDIVVQSDSMKLALGTYTELFTESGTYTRYVRANSVSSIVFGGSTQSAWYITSVGLYAINTNYVVRVVDLDGVVVRELSVEDTPAYFYISRNWLTFSYDWTDDVGEFLAEGCYLFEVSEPCECSNGGFVAEDLITVQNQWTGSAGGWDFNGTGVAIFNGSLATDDAFIINALCDDVEYEVSYTLNAMNSGNTFYVRCGATTGTFRTTDGTYTETVIANASTTAAFAIVGVTGSGGAFQLSNLRIRRKERTFAFRSNIFDLKQEHPCTSVIAACCDSDNLQAGYGDTFFQPRMRLKLTFGKPQYEPISIESYKGAFGTKRNYYYRGERIKLLQFGCSEYAHDFLAHLAGYDHVYLDGNAIFINSQEYAPSWDTIWDWGEGELQVSDKVELIEKRRCSSISTGCEGSLPIAIDSDGGGLGGTDGGVVVIDGRKGAKEGQYATIATTG
jgi:hypothetical protein